MPISITKPTVGGSEDTWGETINTALDTIVTQVNSTSAINVNAGGGLTGGGTLGSDVTISHDDTSAQASVNNSGRTYIQDITLDTYGHVTGISSATETVTNTDTTYTADGNYGMALSGTAFRLENDRRRNSSTDDVWTGNTHDYIHFDADVGLRFYSAAAEDMRLLDNGTLHVDGDIIAYSTTISDERLKTNIQPIEAALDKVCQLNGYTFDYIRDNRASAGVIAQEVEAVLPSAITEQEGGFHGEDGQPYKAVQYDQLHGLLIEAIKELKAEIEALKNGG